MKKQDLEKYTLNEFKMRTERKIKGNGMNGYTLRLDLDKKMCNILGIKKDDEVVLILDKKTNSIIIKKEC